MNTTTQSVQEQLHVPVVIDEAVVLQLWSIHCMEQMIHDWDSEEMVELFKSGYRFTRDDMQVWLDRADQEERDELMRIVLDYCQLVLHIPELE